MNKVVYIVHCIDTEGPLYESIDATFKRINDVFGLKLNPSLETLKQLQNKKIPLKGKENAISNFIAPERLNYNDTWTKIDQMLDDITSDNFRNDFLDSFGNSWIYNWFCVDHVGFSGDNPRRRSLGFHTVFDHYMQYNKIHNRTQDLIQWHFHPLPLIKDAHRAGTGYVSSHWVFEILARKIIDKKWFPAAFRPGFHTERPDSHWFLEQWIPFDYANQSTKGIPTDQPDLANGRFGDWRRAPKEWEIYHPDHDDYQKVGNCRRWIARCLNVEARSREINLDDFRDGFKRAESGKPTLISFTDHDFRDMKPKIIKIRNMIKQVSEEFPHIKFKFANAIEAMRSVIGIKELKNPEFKIEIEQEKHSAILKIKANNDIFGPQPFFAIKTKSNQYFWENLDFQGENEWSYTFDFNTLPLESVKKIGLAANSPSGVSEIYVLNIEKNKFSRNILNN